MLGVPFMNHLTFLKWKFEAKDNQVFDSKINLETTPAPAYISLLELFTPASPETNEKLLAN